MRLLMRIYEVYYKDYQKKKTEKIAFLPERRMDPSRQNGLEWARRLLGGGVQDPHSIFTIFQEVDQRLE